ncbi:MAG: aminopeptidase [Candidatus Methylophosphatis roskildensis]
MRRRTLALLALLVVAGLLGACGTPAYYLQAAGGQLELLRLTRTLDDARNDPDLPEALRDKLARAGAIRDFASRELGLPDNGSYRKYADLRRPYVVWNVFATDELSIEPHEWCFPVAGCVSYRGYFAQADAEEFADDLRRAGHDVYVAGIAAYSTLGWFDDPLLNTFMHYPDTELARLIFHELAHQVVYAGGDSEFNESFAMTVETAGVRRWLARNGSRTQREEFEAAQRRREDFAALVLTYRDALGRAYESGDTAEHKRKAKTRLLGELGDEYRRLRDGAWGGFAGYDRWFGQEINNAVLASIGLYHQRVPAFEALLAAEGDDLPRFYARVGELARLSRPAREVELGRLVPSLAASR